MEELFHEKVRKGYVIADNGRGSSIKLHDNGIIELRNQGTVLQLLPDGLYVNGSTLRLESPEIRLDAPMIFQGTRAIGRPHSPEIDTVLSTVGPALERASTTQAISTGGSSTPITADATYVTIDDETSTLPNSFQHASLSGGQLHDAKAGGSEGIIQYNHGGVVSGASTLYYDAANSRLGINEASPTVTLDVGGAARIQGGLDMATNLISNVADPVNLQDAATRNYVDNSIAVLSSIYLALDGGNANTDIDIGSYSFSAKHVHLAAQPDGVLYLGPTVRFAHAYHGPNSQGYNTFLGRYAGNFSMDASDSSHSYQGSFNTGLGNLALSALTTGFYNTAVGHRAGYKITTGVGNFCFGVDAGKEITTSSYNFALGSFALSNYNGSSSHMAIGNYAGNSITGGSNSLFIGHQTGRNANYCDSSIFIGPFAGYNSQADRSIYIGESAGHESGATSNDSVVLGYFAAYNATPQYAILMGTDAGRYGTTLYGSIGIGNAAHKYNQGKQNVAIGASALYGVSGYGGDNNTCIGFHAGKQLKSTNYAILIGAGIEGTDTTPDYTLNIGDLYTGIWDPTNKSAEIKAPLQIDGNLIFDVTSPKIKSNPDTSTTPTDLEIETGSGKTIKLTNEVWDDQQVNIGAAKLPSSNAPSWVNYKSSMVLAFSPSQDNTIYFDAQLTHRYKLGEPIEFHIHYVTPDSNTGDHVWEFTYSWADVNEVFPAATTVTATLSAPGVADKHILGEIVATITPPASAGNDLSGILLCSLTRKGTDTSDTYGNDIYLIGLDFHIPIDTPGSRGITTK